MKIKIILWMIIISCGRLSFLDASVVSLDYEPVAVCLGTIVFPKKVHPYPNLYYNGRKLSIDVDLKEKEVKVIPYSLEEAQSKQQFHMIICLECKFASKENTVQYLYIPKNVSYKFYTLSAARQYNNDKEVDGYLWTLTQDQLSADRIIPDDTIIFLFNADLIEGLHVKSWPQNSNVRILPEIVIKKSACQQDLSDAMTQGAAASVGLNRIHKHNATCIKQINQKAVLSMKS